MVANSSKSLSPREIHRRLVEALNELERAQRNAIIWFAEVLRRKVYRELGYSSIYQYAELELGFKKSKTAQFLRLCDCFKELPGLRQSVASGELSWTKAREVAKVATPETEDSWIQEAKRVPNRELERRVSEKKRQARAGISGREQVTLEMGVGEDGTAVSGEKDFQPVEPPVPMDVHVRMTSDQYARYQALMEALARGRVKGDKAELLLTGLEQLALAVAEDNQHEHSEKDDGADEEIRAAKSDGPKEFTRVNSRSPYQVIVQACPQCKQATIPANGGEKTLAPRELRAILCDAYVRGSGERNKAAIPGKLRRAVLERDRFRCRSAGCGRTSFLAVHHRIPREAGGANILENLVTLCSGCHQTLHDGP